MAPVTLTYDQGENAKITCLCTNGTGGAPVNPSQVLFVCLKPDGVTYVRYTYGVDLNLSNPAVGTFVALLSVDQATTPTALYQGRFYCPLGQPGQFSAPFQLIVTADSLV